MFLVTTALARGWEAEERVVLLGPWCITEEDRHLFNGTQVQVMSSPWDDRARFYEAAEYATEVFERMLKGLAEYLNAVHGRAYSVRYWRIVIGPWLLHFVHALYDRYVHLMQALEMYADLRTRVMDSSCYITPATGQGSIEWLAYSQRYNWQLISQVFAACGVVWPRERCFVSPLPTHPRAGVSGSRIVRWLRTVARELPARASAGIDMSGRVGLFDVSGSPRSLWALAARSRLGMLPRHIPWEGSKGIGQIHVDQRRLGLSRLRCCDRFEQVAVRTLAENVPVAYIEDYEALQEQAARRYPSRPAVVVAETAWYWSEPFKIAAAAWAEQGTRLVPVQHGGGYGMFRFSALERHEAQIADAYLVWGWAGSVPAVTRNVPAPRLSSLARKVARAGGGNTREGILFVPQDHPRFLYRFHSTPTGQQWEDQWAWGLRFLAALPNPVRQTLTLRPPPVEQGHHLERRILARFPDLALDRDPEFQTSIFRRRIVVVDYLGTACLEALVSDVPTVLFWHPEHWEVRCEAKPWLDALCRASILWHSPEGAAEHVARVYAEPLAWWKDPSVQEARTSLISRFGLNGPDWLARWQEVLEEEQARHASSRGRT